MSRAFKLDDAAPWGRNRAEYLACCQAFQPRHDHQQAGFASAAGAKHANRLASINRQRDATQDFNHAIRAG